VGKISNGIGALGGGLGGKQAGGKQAGGKRVGGRGICKERRGLIMGCFGRWERVSYYVCMYVVLTPWDFVFDHMAFPSAY
jgi:hypothetical protein